MMAPSRAAWHRGRRPSLSRPARVALAAPLFRETYHANAARILARVTAAPRPVDARHSLALARDVLATEARAIDALAARLSDAFVAALELLLACRGRVVVSGIGKSGHVARKLAATLASTGTPAFFVHPAEASHGDLGMIAADDVVLMLSNSGETDELVMLVPHIRRCGAAIVAITGDAHSSLAREASVHLDAAVDAEACPLGLAPTASTTAALALGDALAIALLDARGFSAADFARSHPGGSLGRRLLVKVADVMRVGDALPIVRDDATLAAALVEMTGKGMGMTAVVDAARRAVGVFTDGDLRRAIDRIEHARTLSIAALMTKNPRSIAATRLAIDCVEAMETPPRVTNLLVTDGDGVLIGAVHMHDLFRARVI
jgi:arabinose-5-phosphate isomerase